MMLAFVTFNSSLLPLIKDLYSSNPWKFKFLGFRRKRTPALGNNRSEVKIAFILARKEIM